MAIPEDQDETRNRMVDLWHRYGEQYSVFVPEEQPAPTIWEPSLPEPDEKGRLDPQVLKHWQYLFPTKEFLRQRYAKHHILEGPFLFFDCLVPKFQKRIDVRWAVDKDGLEFTYEVEDTHEWYDSALRIGIFHWQVGFSCRSVRCQRDWCKLHRRNPDRINPIDIYSLIEVFENCGPGKALSVVSKGFGVKLLPFASKGTTTRKISRYRVPKQAIYDLFDRYRKMRAQHVDPLTREAREIIQACSFVPWHSRMFDKDYAFLSKKVISNLNRIKDPSVKAYLWLLIQQEEKARNTKDSALSISDAALAKALGVSRPTANKYRQHLRGLGLIEVLEKKTGKKKGIEIVKAKY